MRRYGAKKAPKGASTRNFALLSIDDQIAQVKKLKSAGLAVVAIAQMTGLSAMTIVQILETGAIQ